MSSNFTGWRKVGSFYLNLCKVRPVSIVDQIHIHVKFLNSNRKFVFIMQSYFEIENGSVECVKETTIYPTKGQKEHTKAVNGSSTQQF